MPGKIIHGLTISLFIIILVFASPAFGAWSSGNTHFWNAIGLTGGDAALDGISGVSIGPMDTAFTVDVTGQTVYHHRADIAGGRVESSPNVIIPDDIGAGVTAWMLLDSRVSGFYANRIYVQGNRWDDGSGNPKFSVLKDSTGSDGDLNQVPIGTAGSGWAWGTQSGGGGGSGVSIWGDADKAAIRTGVSNVWFKGGTGINTTTAADSSGATITFDSTGGGGGGGTGVTFFVLTHKDASPSSVVGLIAGTTLYFSPESGVSMTLSPAGQPIAGATLYFGTNITAGYLSGNSFDPTSGLTVSGITSFGLASFESGVSARGGITVYKVNEKVFTIDGEGNVSGASATFSGVTPGMLYSGNSTYLGGTVNAPFVTGYVTPQIAGVSNYLMDALALAGFTGATNFSTNAELTSHTTALTGVSGEALHTDLTSYTDAGSFIGATGFITGTTDWSGPLPYINANISSVSNWGYVSGNTDWTGVPTYSRVDSIPYAWQTVDGYLSDSKYNGGIAGVSSAPKVILFDCSLVTGYVTCGQTLSGGQTGVSVQVFYFPPDFNPAVGFTGDWSNGGSVFGGPAYNGGVSVTKNDSGTGTTGMAIFPVGVTNFVAGGRFTFMAHDMVASSVTDLTVTLGVIKN